MTPHTPLDFADGPGDSDPDAELRLDNAVRQQIAAEAAAWIDRLSEMDEAEHARLADWLRKSPVHVQEYLRMCALNEELALLGKRKALSQALSPEAPASVDRLATLDAAQARGRTILLGVGGTGEHSVPKRGRVVQEPVRRLPGFQGSRRPRLHVPGGLYYVVQRGNARQPIFSDASDYATFEQLLAAMVMRCRTRVHAFYWTKDAIHFAVQIADLPVGRLMQRLTSQYARKVHRKHGESGHLFQQRYHALLVDPDTYLLRLVRYIHLLPVRAGISKEPGEYTMSSHNAYIGMTHVPWLSTGPAMRTLAPRLDDARNEYRRFMSEASDEWDEDLFDKGCQDDPRVLGDRAFLQVVPRHMRTYRSTHSLDMVIDTVSSKLGLERGEVLSRSRQRRLAMARALITWYATERGIATLAEVARRLERDPSTLFVAVERYRTLRPDLFNIGSLHDSGPLLRRVMTLPQPQR